MNDSQKRALYRINAVIGLVFQLTVLWTIARHSLAKDRNVTLLVVTLIAVAGSVISAPFNWPDKDRRMLTVAHIVIKVLMIVFLVYALI